MQRQESRTKMEGGQLAISTVTKASGHDQDLWPRSILKIRTSQGGCGGTCGWKVVDQLWMAFLVVRGSAVHWSTSTGEEGGDDDCRGMEDAPFRPPFPCINVSPTNIIHPLPSCHARRIPTGSVGCWNSSISLILLPRLSWRGSSDSGGYTV